MEQRKFAILNNPAIWRAAVGIMGSGDLPTGEINTRVYSAGTKYQNGNVLVYATTTEPVFRYVKNYRKYNLNFSLFMYSDDPDKLKVEKYLDSLVKSQIKKTNISEAIAIASISDFVYLSDTYK